MTSDVGTMLAALSLEAAAAMVFAAGVVCGSLLTCCCLSQRGEHAESNSRLKKEPTTVSGVPLPSSLGQCERVYFPVSGSKVDLIRLAQAWLHQCRKTCVRKVCPQKKACCQPVVPSEMSKRGCCWILQSSNDRYFWLKCVSERREGVHCVSLSCC